MTWTEEKIASLVIAPIVTSLIVAFIDKFIFTSLHRSLFVVTTLALVLGCAYLIYWYGNLLSTAWQYIAISAVIFLTFFFGVDYSSVEVKDKLLLEGPSCKPAPLELHQIVFDDDQESCEFAGNLEQNVSQNYKVFVDEASQQMTITAIGNVAVAISNENGLLMASGQAPIPLKIVSTTPENYNVGLYGNGDFILRIEIPAK